MWRIFGLAAALGALFAALPAGAQTVKYLNQLGGAATIVGTNTLPVCQVSGGCGSGNPLVSATVAQLNTWFQSQISATAPIAFNAGVIAFGAQSANMVLAGPSSGSAAAPAFRTLAAADMPATAPSYKTGSYTLAASDLDNPVCLKGSSAASTFTIPAAGTAGFGAGAVYVVCDLDANSLSLVAQGGGFLGLGTNPLTQNMWATLTSDGSNWLVLER